MTAHTTDTETSAPTKRDPYALRSLDQILAIPDGGEFITDFMQRHGELLQQMNDHNAEFGNKGAKGALQLTISYEMGGSGDLGIKASAEFKPPKKPASHGHAYVNRQGELTLHSPLLTRMHGGVRDVDSFDPETGEIRDI